MRLQPCSRKRALTYGQARRALEPAGASSARARGRPRGGGGSLPRALAWRCWSGFSASSRPAAPICRSTRAIRPNGFPSCLPTLVHRSSSLRRRCAYNCPSTASASSASTPRPGRSPNSRPALRGAASSRKTPLTSSTPPARPALQRASSLITRALTNKVLTLGMDFGAGPDLRVALLSSPGFDPSIEQATLPLVHGASIVVISDAARESPARFWDYVERKKVTL